jgi:hypothetical protein
MFNLVANHVWTRTSTKINREERRRWRKIVGNKAVGLISLPEWWTPPFLVVGTSLYHDWSQASQSDRHAVIAPTAHILNSYNAERPGWSNYGLIIRSSAVEESLSDRGAYQSLELPADFNEQSIIRKIDEIFSAFLQSGADDEMACTRFG